jgi:hypothetical protein
MSVTEIGGLLVSFFALGVAVYGVFERQRAVYASVRVRITELLGDVEELNVEEDKYVEAEYANGENQGEEPPPALARYSLTGRRALLTYQALALIHRLTRSRFGRSDDLHLTPSEYVSLANSLVRLGDVVGGREQYEAALASTEESTDRVRIATHLGLANCLFDLRRPEEGRQHFSEAVRLHSPDEIGQQMAFGVCINEWLSRELQAGNDGEPAAAVHAGRAIVERAADVAQPPAWALDGQMALRRRATRPICVNGEYADEIVGYEDDDLPAPVEPPVPTVPGARGPAG